MSIDTVNGAASGPVRVTGPEAIAPSGPGWSGRPGDPGEPWSTLEITGSQRRIPGEVGVWIFIFGEMCLYGLLFISFMSARGSHPRLYAASADQLDTTIGVVNTLLLLTASVLVAYGIRGVREGLSKRAPLLFGLAFLCGLGFVFDKYLEYSHLISIGADPTHNAFFTWYFVLTGIHLTHVFAGLGVLVFLRRVASKVSLSPKDIRAMECGASWWHLVDLLWVVLFPLLYLVK